MKNTGIPTMLLFYGFCYLTGSGIEGRSKMKGRDSSTIKSTSSRNNSVLKSVFWLQLKENHYSIKRDQTYTYIYTHKIVPLQKLSRLHNFLNMISKQLVMPLYSVLKRLTDTSLFTAFKKKKKVQENKQRHQNTSQ